MTHVAIAPIESTIHTTNTWLKELADELGWEDRCEPTTPSGRFSTPCAIG